ncbi:protein of unknown function [Tenacibaculum sp. MAR_2009_124]|uniref:DUF4249 domain-containing protein n=1 Tax=Tenacibaculum sp. MAR_2009_124 TaxID=1250059 RepID=UPI0008985A85|nr:DUF4249 domain-containing protein [Tenacibaculum sp. MAR_2009_124]SEC92428.1 protein of unknown function [Tenacibaculum sp. MAR_2009_124]
MKTFIKKYIIRFSLVLTVFINGCIEPIEFSSNTYENNLVVRSILTNEFKKHSIELSRTIPIDSTQLDPVRNAEVSIVDNNGTIYRFQEEENGVYTSSVNFAAEANKSYSLKIQTANGSSYTSTSEKLPPLSEIEEINTAIELNDESDTPDFVFRVNSITNTHEGNYYRYAYDETFKIKTNIWSPKKLEVVSDTSPYEFRLVDKIPEIDGTGFCYVNKLSSSILLSETFSLDENKVTNIPVRRIPLDNYIIGIRYSVLIKQYVLNKNTYDFYSLLDKFSNPDNVFSQIQVGNVPSNISSDIDPDNDKVLGFFEVSSVHEKRIFVNRSEITNLAFINYPTPLSCTDRPNPLIEDRDGSSPLLELLESGWIYQSPPDIPIPPPGKPYALARKPCGDCRQFGEVSPPDFWIE